MSHEKAHDKVYRDAINLLKIKDYSRVKLRRKLLCKGHGSQQVDETIVKLVDCGYLREDYYIEARVKGLIRKNYSSSFIRQRLKQEGLDVSVDHILKIYEENGVTEEDQIRQLLIKKISLRTRELERDKIIRFVCSKGHSITRIEEVYQDL